MSVVVTISVFSHKVRPLEGLRKVTDEKFHGQFWFIFFINPAQIRTVKGLQLSPCVASVKLPLRHSGVSANM